MDGKRDPQIDFLLKEAVAMTEYSEELRAMEEEQEEEWVEPSTEEEIMVLSGINHLAFITEDITGTIRFYRDLLGMELFAGIGHDGYRHYFFRLGDGTTQVAFFEYDGARPMSGPGTTGARR